MLTDSPELSTWLLPPIKRGYEEDKMAKWCEWCGGEAKKHRQFYKGKLFCSTDHYSYFRRTENPGLGGELEPHEWASKDSRKKEQVEEVKAVQASQETDW